MKFALHRTRAELAIIVQRLRPYSKALVGAAAPVVVAIVHDVTGYGVDVGVVETVLLSVLTGGSVYRVSNVPKV